MAGDFKARLPETCNPVIAEYSGYLQWRREFNTYRLASEAFPANMALDRQRARLFNIAGPQFSKYAQQNVVIVDDTTTVDQILDGVEASLRPQRLDLQNRMKLFDMRQGSEKSTSFLQKLRELILDAGYGENIERETLVRDLFVHGLDNDDARRLIYQREFTGLTVATCVNLVSSFEVVHGSSPKEDVVSVSALAKSKADQQEPQKTGMQSCSFCGGRIHARRQCPAFGQKCSRCGKLGHFKRVCRSQTVATVHLEEVDEQFSNAPRVMSVRNSAKQQGRKRVPVMIEQKSVIQMLVDTGSDLTMVSRKVAWKLDLENKVTRLRQAPVCLSASGTPVRIFGKVTDAVLEIQNCILVDTIWIAEELPDEAILGRTSLEQLESLKIHYGGDQPALHIASTLLDKKPVTSKVKIQSAGRSDYSQIGVRPVFDVPQASWKIAPVSVIPLKPDAKPVRAPSRWYSREQRDFIEEEVRKLLRDGKIRPSRSSWRSQVVVVKNEQGKQRLVVDYASTINQQTERDAYPIPLMQGLLDKVSEWTCFSKIDLRAAYHQVPLEPREHHLTAFEANGKLYEFTHIPFGLVNAPAVFQRELSKLMDGLPGVVHYFDDLVVGGTTKEKHDVGLDEFLDRAELTGMSLRADKCVFGGAKLNWLGHSISNGTRSPDPDRLQGFMKYPIPLTVNALRRFIGIAVYHSKWIPSFGEIMEPLFKALRSKDLPLNRPCIQAIEVVKTAVSSAVLLVPKQGRELRLETDASGVSVGAILSQDGRPIAYMSHRLSPAERKWSPAELEGYAVILAVRKFRSFLSGKFTVISDQQGMVAALQSKSAVKNAKYARWRLELSDYEFEIQYRPGILNVAADALSRCSALGNELAAKSPSYERVAEIHRRLGHPGVERLTHYINNLNLEHPIDGLQKICSAVCEQCRVCAIVKPRWLQPPEKATLIESTQPWERLSIDFMGPKPESSGGFKYVLTVVDEWSRFPFAFTTKDRSSETVIAALQQLFSLFGPPKQIHSDRGKEFLSDSFLAFLRNWGVTKSSTNPYNPRANGQCERFNGIIWRTVRCLMEDKQLRPEQWPSEVSVALSAIRSLKCRSTGSTPHELLLNFHRQHPSPIDGQDYSLRVGESALLRRHVRTKDEPLGEEVAVLEVYPQYAVIQRHGKPPDTVNIRHLSKLPKKATVAVDAPIGPSPKDEEDLPTTAPEGEVDKQEATANRTREVQDVEEREMDAKTPIVQVTRSGRIVQPPMRLGVVPY